MPQVAAASDIRSFSVKDCWDTPGSFPRLVAWQGCGLCTVCKRLRGNNHPERLKSFPSDVRMSTYPMSATDCLLSNLRGNVGEVLGHFIPLSHAQWCFPHVHPNDAGPSEVDYCGVEYTVFINKAFLLELRCPSSSHCEWLWHSREGRVKHLQPASEL